MTAILELQGLCLHYTLGDSRVPVLEQTQLHVAAGERVAIVGPSGSGKTSLLLLIAGLEKPSAGDVIIAGTRLNDLDRDGLADLRRDRLGIVFQNFHLVPGLSALENVALPLEIAARPGAREAAATALAQVGLSQRSQHYPRQLSGGEQQRVAIARALIHDPALILADEPTGNLDEHTREAVADLLFTIARDEHRSLVLVTHDDAMAQRCDRILRLHDGCLHEEASTATPVSAHGH